MESSADEDEEFSMWAAQVEGEAGAYELQREEPEEVLNMEGQANTEMALQVRQSPSHAAAAYCLRHAGLRESQSCITWPPWHRHI